jgi:hypothetical protein
MKERVDRLERHLIDDHRCNCLTPEERKEYEEAVRKNPTAPVTTHRLGPAEGTATDLELPDPVDIGMAEGHRDAQKFMKEMDYRTRLRGIDKYKKGGPPGPLEKHKRD